MVRGQQSDLLLGFENEVAPALDRLDFVAGQSQGAVDPGQGEGVGFASDIHQKGAQDRESEGELELEAGSAAGLGADPDRATHAFDHVLDHIESEAAA